MNDYQYINENGSPRDYYEIVNENGELCKEIKRLDNIVNGINNYCFKRMAELDDIKERDEKLEDFCKNKINAFLEVREKIKELERSGEE